MAKVTTDLVQQNPDGAYQAPVVIAVNADGTPISGGGGGAGGGLTNTELRATPVPVSGTVTATGPLTNAQLTAVTGVATVAAWDGVAASATTNSILKAMYAQNALIITLLGEIDTNTTPVGP